MADCPAVRQSGSTLRHSPRGARAERSLSRGPPRSTYGDDGIDIRNFRAARRFRPPVALRPGRVHARSPRERERVAARGARSRVAGSGRVRDGRSRRHDPGGRPSDPSGDWRIRLTRVSLPQTRSNALPPLDVTASGRLAGGRTSIDATANAGGANSIRVTGSAPLSSEGALDLKIDGRLDAGLANNFLSLSGRRMTGAVTLALQLRGTAARPVAQGSVRLANGEFRDDVTGFKLSSDHRDFRRQRRHDPHRPLERRNPRRRNDLGERRRAARSGGGLSRLDSRDRQACAARGQQHRGGDRRPCAHHQRQAHPEAQR